MIHTVFTAVKPGVGGGEVGKGEEEKEREEEGNNKGQTTSWLIQVRGQLHVLLRCETEGTKDLSPLL